MVGESISCEQVFSGVVLARPLAVFLVTGTRLVRMCSSQVLSA